MVGREQMGGRLNYSVHSLKGEGDFRKKRATVHEISNNIHIGNKRGVRRRCTLGVDASTNKSNPLRIQSSGLNPAALLFVFCVFGGSCLGKRT